MAGESLNKGWFIFKKSFRMVYDYIGITMVISALWFLIGLLPILAISLTGLYTNVWVVLIAAGLTLFTLSPATAASYKMTARIVVGEETVVRDFFRDFGSYFFKSVGLVALNLLILVILVTDFVFTVRNPNEIIRMLSGLWVYFILFWGLMSLYLFPVLVQQNAGVLKSFQRAALLTLDNIVVTIIVGLTVLLFTALSIVIAASVLLLFMGTVGIIQNFALKEVMQKYTDQPKTVEEGER